MSSPKGDPSALRAQNRRTVLNHLRRHGPVSRTQLVDSTGLSAASISGITAELIQDRLLVERSVGEAGATGGRRPIFLDIHYDVHYAIGLKLREDRLEAVLTDLSTRVLVHLTEDLSGKTPPQVTAHIKAVVKKLGRRGKIDPSDLIGIGIGLSGVIDARTGTAVHAPLLGWRQVPIGRLVAEACQLPTFVDNDVSAFAAAERLFGNGKHATNFLTVAIGRGVGAALVVNGEVYRGRNGGAGEFGHNVVAPHGRTCSCGRQGCLEAYTAEPALLAQFTERHPEHAGLNVDTLVRLAEGGHPGALDVLATAGALLGTHLSYLVNTLNPELIVVGGEGGRLGPAYFTPVRDTLRRLAFDGLADDLPLVVVPWHDDDFTPWARGAASLAVQHAFETGGLLKGTAMPS